MLSPGTPFERDRLRSFSAARRTSATSSSRTRYPSGPRPTGELAEVLLGVETGLGAQGELALRGFDPPGRQLHVLAAQRRLDVGDRQLPRGERLAIEPHAHRVAARTVQAHARDARQHAEPLDQHALGVVGQLERR